MDPSAMSCPCVFEDTPFLANTCGATFTLFMGLLESVLRGRCDVADPCRRLGRPDLPLDGAVFDFIVVGAGVAGPVVASRLSEDPRWSVLLMEAGPEEPTATQLPAFAISGVRTPLDWNYTTVPQRNACLNNGGVCKWPRGKMVSGTGSLHGMMYTRGHPSIYDSWAKAGNEGWSYREVLPYFIKSERNGNPQELDDGYHGFNGPLSVKHFPYHPALAEGVVAAGQELGYRRGDLNGANQTGVNVAQMTVNNGLRHSTPRAYLRPASTRPNLHVATDSTITRVLIDPNYKRAYGVQFYDRNGNVKTVYASKEVILSAGAVGSPQLLLLSGVGPTEELRPLGIQVVKDLPVGRNLRNHVSVSVGFFINETSTETLTMESFNLFLRTRSGPMASTGLTQTTAFLLSKYATNGVPDIQLFFDGYGARCSRTGQADECTNGKLSDAEGSTCGPRYINARPTNILPRSVGKMQLRSANPLDYPLIDPQYLTNDRDMKVLVEGIKMVLNFTRTKALAPWDFKLNTKPVAGCESVEFASDDYWACVIKRATGPENHQVGTCRMGPAGDAKAVVDPQLRVHGLGGLRVIDASVFPTPPNSNLVAAIVMTAEKGADMVKARWAHTNGWTYGPLSPAGVLG